MHVVKHNPRRRHSQEKTSTKAIVHCSLSREDEAVHLLLFSRDIVLFDCRGLDETQLRDTLVKDVLVAAALLTADCVLVAPDDEPLSRLPTATKESLAVVFALSGTGEACAKLAAVCERRVLDARGCRGRYVPRRPRGGALREFAKRPIRQMPPKAGRSARVGGPRRG